MRAFMAAVCLLLFVSACNRVSDTARHPHSIVGTWLVTDPNAPFPYHLYVFNADGTMHQANPDAGDPRASDSDGKGAWSARDGVIHAKWVELMADRTSHAYIGRLEMTMQVSVSGDSLTATEVAHLFDASGAETAAPATPKVVTGARVLSQ